MTHEMTEPAIFLKDVLEGLSASPKTLLCKYFYNERGSLLFEKICELDEYYLTRAELELMRTQIEEIVQTIGTQCCLVELGSGSSLKTELILERLQSPSIYVPVDISQEMLMRTAERFRQNYTQFSLQPVCADFTKPFDLPRLKENLPTIVYFPGSTIGNFSPEQAMKLLRRIRDSICDEGGLLVGYDLKKNRSILEAAYDDSLGVTGEFNLNMLKRINDELGADFDVSQFEHRAIYNEDQGRVEMHLVSLGHQLVKIGDTRISLETDETIHTENSYKFTVEEFSQLAMNVGLHSVETWYDSRGYFALQYLKVRSEAV